MQRRHNRLYTSGPKMNHRKMKYASCNCCVTRIGRNIFLNHQSYKSLGVACFQDCCTAQQRAASSGPSSSENSVTSGVPHDIPTAQRAIDLVPCNGTVWVSAGIYRERIILKHTNAHLVGVGGAAEVVVNGCEVTGGAPS